MRARGIERAYVFIVVLNIYPYVSYKSFAHDGCVILQTKDFSLMSLQF